MILGALLILALVSSGLLWQRISSIQERLARQSADATAQAMEARIIARQSQELAQETAARVAVFETRLSEVLTRATQLMMDRFAHIFRLLTVLGSSAKPTMSGSPDLVERIGKAHERLLAPHRARFTIAPREVMRYLRLLAFSGSNPHITDGRLLTATEIVTLVLNGTTKEPTC